MEKIDSVISVVIDNDPRQKYEVIGPIIKIINLIWLPFLNLLSESFGDKLIRKSREATHVKEHKTTHKALEIMYNFDGGIDFRNGIANGLFTYIWLHLMNPKALRNRLKLVKKILRKAILNFNGEEIKILNLGAGSARAILEIIAELKKDKVNIPKVRAKFIDISQDALDYSKEIALKSGISLNDWVWQREKAQSIEKICNDFRPDVVEMVGLMDYFNSEKALNLLKGINNYLNEDGVLISCNIKDNSERKFISKVVGWDMIYRDEFEISKLINDAGFSSEKSKIILEPLKIHCLFLAKK